MSAPKGKGLATAELELFHAQFKMLLDTGLPLPEGIRRAAREARDPGFKDALDRVAKRLDEGATLAAALEAEPDFFSPDFIALLRVGEHGGELGPALRLALEQEFFQRGLSSRIRRALLYPALVFGAVTAAYSVLIVVVYPLLLDLFRATRGVPPAESAGIYGLFRWFGHYGIIVGAGLALVLIMARQQDARRQLDQLWLNLPIYRRLLLSRFLASFSQGLAIALRAGIPLAEALGLLGKITANLALRERVEAAAARAGEGAKLSEAMDPLFPPLYRATVATAEDAGALPESLAGLAEMYRDEAESGARLFVQGLDLALILGLGTWTGFLLTAYYHLYLRMLMSIDSMTIW
jgi:type IV pilus assembly protein PilC